jgi:uncharacterized SAM-binding protein YcdF (DUF218 family)
MSYLEPALPLFLVLGVIALVRLWRSSRRGSRPWLMTASMAGILLLSSNFFTWALARPLEIWYDDHPVPSGAAEAIVVLSGSVAYRLPNRPYSYVGPDTYIRLRHVIWLFNEWKSLPVLVCGGGARRRSEPHSELMKRVLEAEGIPRDLIWTEGRSRSTRENALYGAEVLRRHGVTRIVLVVEANSMLRAAACFRKLGFTVIPSPIRFTHVNGGLMDILPTWRAMERNGETIHEVLGLVWYRLRGWI